MNLQLLPVRRFSIPVQFVDDCDQCGLLRQHEARLWHHPGAWVLLVVNVALSGVVAVLLMQLP